MRTPQHPGTLTWRKSSYSAENGVCVEVAWTWRKSTYSSQNGTCVEVSWAPEATQIRDSKNPAAPHLTLPHTHWSRFLTTLPTD